MALLYAASSRSSGRKIPDSSHHMSTCRQFTNSLRDLYETYEMMMRLLICFIPCLFRVVNGFQPLSTGIIEMRGGRNVARRSPLFRAEAPTSPSLESEQLSVPTLSKFDPVNWTPKRLHNSRLFRSAAILGALALAGYSTKAPLTKISTRASATINILSFGTWFGTVVYTTFVAGITMYKNLPRQTFGKLQARLFPKYFSLCSITILLQVRRVSVVFVLPVCYSITSLVIY